MTLDDLRGALRIVNVQAFLRVLREGESNQDESAYTILYGGDRFEFFADHPRKRFPIIYQGKETYTTAAGAYQITETTWNVLVKKFGFEDFSPANQDLAAVALIAGRHALEVVIDGRVNEAIRLLTSEWTSLALPKRQAAAQAIFEAYGGTSSAAHQPVSVTSVQKEVAPVGPAIIIPILAELAKGLIPQLGSLFGSGSEVQQRNIAAASVVADTIVRATGALNLQEATERIQSDPAALQAAKQAVSDIWPSITEVGSGGIDSARKAAIAPDQLPFYKQGVFWITVSLLPLIYVIVLASLGKWEFIGDITSETRAQVIGTALGTLLGGIIGYFYGTSAGSQRKTDILGAK